MKEFKKHKAQLIQRHKVNDRTILLTFVVRESFDSEGQSIDASPSFFVRGGQYVIVDTGLLLADGKPLKRAYSILPREISLLHWRELPPSQQASSPPHQLFSLAVFIVQDGDEATQTGLGSRAVSNLSEGDFINLSGPWGKMTHTHPALGYDQLINPKTIVQKGQLSSPPWVNVPSSEPIEPSACVRCKPIHLVVAGGTGITGGLHLFGQNDAPYLNRHLIWIDDGLFLPRHLVKSWMKAAGNFEKKDLEAVPVNLAEETANLTIIPWGQNDLRTTPVEQALYRFIQDSYDEGGWEGVALDVAYFGDGHYLSPIMEQVEICLREFSHTPRKRPVGLSVRLRKEFYYNRPVEMKGGG